jgi:hypothetical protein
MFEKISGFFKQFTRRRKRQSGETTIMESKEPGADEFGLDGDFGDLDTFGDTEGTGDSGDFVGTADVGDTAGVGDFEDTGGFGDVEESAGGMSDEFDSGAGVESEFSDFDITASDADISTGGTDFDERTVSDEISGGTESEFGEPGGEFGDAFAVAEEGPALEGAEPEAKAASSLKGILTSVIAFIVAIGVGVAFQLFAWPTVSKLVGLASTDEVQVGPETQLNEKKREQSRLNKELGEFKKVGAPAQVQNLKTEIAATRDAQGPMEDLKAALAVAKEKEAEYDGLIKKMETLEASISQTGNEIENVRLEIEQAKKRVIELARQTEVEYERFSFELARAELGQRMFLELQIQDIASFREEVAELESRLTKLSMAILVSTAADAASSEEARMAETSGN